MKRVTPMEIKGLEKDEIFVFGSNLAGKHGKGAAKDAMQWGAKYGKGFGLQGQTFAIPTKDSNLETLPLEDIYEYVNKFIEEFDWEFEKRTWLITPIGCGLAGYRAEEIAPAFEPLTEYGSVWLPRSFWEEYMLGQFIESSENI